MTILPLHDLFSTLRPTLVIPYNFPKWINFSLIWKTKAWYKFGMEGILFMNHDEGRFVFLQMNWIHFQVKVLMRTFTWKCSFTLNLFFQVNFLIHLKFTKQTSFTLFHVKEGWIDSEFSHLSLSKQPLILQVYNKLTTLMTCF